MLFGTCAVGLFDTGCCDGCDGTAPKLMLMLGSKARRPSCQSFTESCVYNTHSHGPVWCTHITSVYVPEYVCEHVCVCMCLCVCACVCVCVCVCNLQV